MSLGVTAPEGSPRARMGGGCQGLVCRADGHILGVSRSNTALRPPGPLSRPLPVAPGPRGCSRLCT